RSQAVLENSPPGFGRAARLSGENEKVPRPGERHVEKAQVLGVVPTGEFGTSAAEARRPGRLQAAVERNAHGKPLLPIECDRGLVAAALRSDVRHEDDRPLEPLGLMDGEQLDGSTVRAVERVCLRLDWICVGKLEQLAGKAGATSLGRVVPAPGQLEELLHVGKRLLAKGGAGNRHRVLGLLEQDAKQGADPQPVPFLPELGIKSQKPVAAAPLVSRQIRLEQRTWLPQA